jgi:hypothetical protein
MFGKVCNVQRALPDVGYATSARVSENTYVILNFIKRHYCIAGCVLGSRWIRTIQPSLEAIDAAANEDYGME